METTRSWGIFNSLLGAFFLAFALFGPLEAQEPAQVTGTVTDAAGQPIPAANVQIEGMQLGTSTNQEGRYLLVVPASRVQGQEVTITARLIGRSAQSETVTLESGASLAVDFTLEEDPLRLEELVVTGAGTQQQREQLGITISSVEAEAIEQSRETNLVDALSGQAANVEITGSGGEPGAGSYIRIRGANSLLGDNQPLFVIDGVPVSNDDFNPEPSTQGTVSTNRIFDLNPSDIANIDILKGASASAIYGSRAANGVVLITTKSGQAGQSDFSYRITTGIDEVNKTPDLQRQYGRGLSLEPFGGEGNLCTDTDASGLLGFTCAQSWGPEISPDEAVDHSDEVFDTGYKVDQYLSWSGGSETTDYFLSIGRLDHSSAIVGPGNYERTTARLRGSHGFTDELRVRGSLAYTDGSGQFIQQGSNVSGLLLGGWRTPPDFSNDPYLVEREGQMLHRSFRNPNPVSLTGNRGYDNPLWIAHEIDNHSGVDRTFGNVGAEYTPFSWLNLDYTLGLDFLAQEETRLFPKSSTEAPQGQLWRSEYRRIEVDHNLTARFTYDLSADIGSTLTIGQNLNHREFHGTEVQGRQQIFGTRHLDFSVSRVPDEEQWTVRTDGYFAQADFDFYEELFLTGALRYDGASTFGGEDNRFLYPKFSASWNFIERWDPAALSFGKIRFAYGVAGKQPPVFSNLSAYETALINDGWVISGGLETIYMGNEGALSETTLGNTEIEPERTSEFEVGTDLAFFEDRLSFGVTYFNQQTEDAILAVDVAPSTGYLSRFANAAEFSTEGWEVTADWRAYEDQTLRWDIGADWARSRSCVESLAGTEELGLTGFVGSTSSVVAPTDVSGEPILNEDLEVVDCHQIGVLYGTDFVRFGRGSRDQVSGVAIDETYDGDPGEIYIGEDGFPQLDPQERVLGDPNPDWTASFRTDVTLFERLTISGLLDVKQGGDMWNGTKGALFFFGTHAETLPFHGDGLDARVGEVLEGESVAGPGADEEVNLNWDSWAAYGLGNSFIGPTSANIEDASYVKLRNITLTYQVGQQDWLGNIGFTSMDFSVSGRNLQTWTDYTGIDPETNLNGQTLGRGIDYFQNPRTRSYSVTVRLNR